MLYTVGSSLEIYWTLYTLVQVTSFAVIIWNIQMIILIGFNGEKAVVNYLSIYYIMYNFCVAWRFCFAHYKNSDIIWPILFLIVFC